MVQLRWAQRRRNHTRRCPKLRQALRKAHQDGSAAGSYILSRHRFMQSFVRPPPQTELWLCCNCVSLGPGATPARDA